MAERERPEWGDIRYSWDEAFMAHAIVGAGRSSCRRLHTGVVIVKDKRIIASGYNGRAPRFKKNCLEEGCDKEICGIHGLNKLICSGSHAETNSLLQDTAVSKDGATLYTVFSPCYACAKQIGAANLAQVVYLKKYQEEFEAVKRYLKKTRIIFRQLMFQKERMYEVIDSVYSQ